jgi:hypothetical protein
MVQPAAAVPLAALVWDERAWTKRRKYSIQLPQVGASWYLLRGYDRNLGRRACFEDNFPYLDSSASFQEDITEQRTRNVRFEASK